MYKPRIPNENSWVLPSNKITAMMALQPGTACPDNFSKITWPNSGTQAKKPIKPSHDANCSGTAEKEINAEFKKLGKEERYVANLLSPENLASRRY